MLVRMLVRGPISRWTLRGLSLGSIVCIIVFVAANVAQHLASVPPNPHPRLPDSQPHYNLVWPCCPCALAALGKCGC
jgi:hypothetical protein